MSRGTLYRFGVFELDPQAAQLRRDGRRVPLQDLPMRLLEALIERPGEVVTREELRDRLWPPDHHLDVDAGLNTAVRRLREALDDDAARPRFVATLPRRGYRFVAPVAVVAAGGSDTPPGEPQGDAGRWRGPLGGRRLRWSLATAALLASVVIGVAMLPTFATLAGGADPEQAEEAAADELYLLARHHAARRTREGLEKAIAAYQSSLARRPDQARAYGGLAAAYALLGAYDYWRPREALEPARIMVERALELDPDSAEAQVALAWVLILGKWDWQGAGEALDRAIALDPDNADARLWYGAYLSGLGRHDEAIAQIERAVALDPTSAVMRTALAWHLFYAGRFDEAVEASERAIEIAPDHYDAWDNLKWIQITRGHATEALIAWARAEDLDVGVKPEREREFLDRGLEEMLRASISAKMERIAAGRWVPPYDLALDHAALGEVETALDWLERSLAERETDLVGVAVDPRLDSLHGNPRFEKIVDAVGARTAGRRWAGGNDSGGGP